MPVGVHKASDSLVHGFAAVAVRAARKGMGNGARYVHNSGLSSVEARPARWTLWHHDLRKQRLE